MKAYKSLDDPDEIRLFRPDLNMNRLMTSMERLSMPTDDLNPDNLLECIKTLCEVDKNWIPHGEGYSLYLRPTVICTNPFLGVSAPTKMLLYVITSPVGPYYKSGSFQPVKLTTDSPFVRAWPGGTGESFFFHAHNMELSFFVACLLFVFSIIKKAHFF